jgi:peptidoglycan/xylan/chitin deacetylase (PgdA/CDA1 family)
MKSFWLSLFVASMVWADAHIFIYHRFNDDRYPTTNTSLQELRNNFEYFKNNGYEVVPLAKLVNALKTNSSIPDNWVVLTIDDNYKSFYNHGFALFKEYDYPFSMFVMVEGTEKKYGDYMSWEELKEIGKFGSLEFHSYAHPHMATLSDEALKADFDKGLALFEQHLGFKPRYFSYPYGEFTPRVSAIAHDYGFEAILNQNTGAVASFSDPYTLDRNALVGKSDLKRYLSYKALDAQWIEPNTLLNDGGIQSLHVNTLSKSTKGGVYISGYGYQDVTLENGVFKLPINKKANQERTRIMVSVGNAISTKLLIIDKYIH